MVMSSRTGSLVPETAKREAAAGYTSCPAAPLFTWVALENTIYHSIPLWQDECRASITAARITPGLTETERKNLVMDAVYRAKEYGQLIEMDDFMKELPVYGYKSSEKNITHGIPRIKYVSEKSIT